MLRQLTGIALFILLLTSHDVPATEMRVSLCIDPLSAGASDSSERTRSVVWRFSVTSSCDKIALDAVSPTSRTVVDQWVAEWRQEKSAELNEVFRYTLTIQNDSNTYAVVHLPDPETDHSLSFTIPLTACGQAVVTFVSPASPQIVQTGYKLDGIRRQGQGYGYDMNVHSRIRANLILPLKGHTEMEGVAFSTLPTSEAKSRHCM